MFQLTAPLREPTELQKMYILAPNVSTHGSLAGADMRIWDNSAGGIVSTHGSLAGAD